MFYILPALISTFSCTTDIRFELTADADFTRRQMLTSNVALVPMVETKSLEEGGEGRVEVLGAFWEVGAVHQANLWVLTTFRHEKWTKQATSVRQSRHCRPIGGVANRKPFCCYREPLC